MTFTTRPELRGTFGAVASTHWLASATGMAVLERGGNAFDAACAAGLRAAGGRAAPERPRRRPARRVLGGGARRAARALRAGRLARGGDDRARSASLGHELVPGTGLLAACVPGSFGGWLLLLEQFGTWRLEDVLAFAIGYAEDGYPVVPGIDGDDRARRAAAARLARLGRALPAAAAGPARPFRNRALAATWRRLLDEARGGSRETRSSARGACSTRASSPRRSTASRARAAGC